MLAPKTYFGYYLKFKITRVSRNLATKKNKFQFLKTGIKKKNPFLREGKQ